jgi:hypothetical protein
MGAATGSPKLVAVQTCAAEKRLQNVTTGGQTTTYTYDGDGRQVNML